MAVRRARSPVPACPAVMTPRPAANLPAAMALAVTRTCPVSPGTASRRVSAVRCPGRAAGIGVGRRLAVPGGDQDELLGLLRQAQAMEAWAANAKLGVLRALIRDEDQPLPGGGYHGDLPDGWSRSLTHEVALALSIPAVSAERQLWVAWDLEARLPGTGELLAAGSLTYPKAKAVSDAFQLLTD